MFKGFYNLSSSMLTNNRSLNVVSNNLANVSTPGFKADELISGTFKEELLYMTSNNSAGSRGESIGSVSMATVPYETVTDFSPGSLEETGGILDFAIVGNGFFEIQGQNGIVYTRSGSFTVDEEGYLFLQGVGRVLGNNGEIFVPTDDFDVAKDGNIIYKNGEPIGKLNIIEFDNFNGFTKESEGVFSSSLEGRASSANVLWKYVETSNVDPVNEMTAMLVNQRTIQSAAQVLKMYDDLMALAVTEIGRV